MTIGKYILRTYRYGSWYSASQDELDPIPRKRKFEQIDEPEGRILAKRHKATFETIESAGWLGPNEEIALYAAAQDDYLQLPDEHHMEYYAAKTSELNLSSLFGAYEGWQFFRPAQNTTTSLNATSQYIQPQRQAAGLPYSHSDLPDLNTRYTAPRRFSSSEDREYLRRYFPGIQFGVRSESLLPHTPPSSTRYFASESPSRASFEDLVESNADSDSRTVTSDCSYVDDESPSVLALCQRATSPEPMGPHELQMIPECTISSVTASPLPLGPRAGIQRALVIAIQYGNQKWNDPNASPMALQGPYADAIDICKLLLEQGYRRKDIRVMTDKPETPESDKPTYYNLKRAFAWLVAGAQPGDRFFLYFAGHGKQVTDYDGDEKDGKDEGIIPCDWSTSFDHSDDYIIVDDYLRDICVNPLPKGAHLTAVFDCCHAGTIMDLPYEHSAKSGDFSQTTHTYESTRIFAQCHERDLPVITTPFNERAREIQADSLKEPVVSCRRIHGSVDARVLCFAACEDSQNAYSSNSSNRGRVTEAFTAGIRALRSAQAQLGFDAIHRLNPTIKHLYKYIVQNASLNQNGRAQDPMLSSSYPMIPPEFNRQMVI